MVELHESGEDYLEAVLVLKKQNGIARSVDVARKLGVSKPSVSRAMSILTESGFITAGPVGSLELTKEGLERAEAIYARHILLTRFLMKICNIDEEQAETNACRIEHDIDEDVKSGIEKWMKENS